MSPADARHSGGTVRWLSVVGARPQFIKLAPVCRAIETHNENSKSCPIEHRIVHTGQHFDREMTDLHLAQMDVPQPNHNLAVGSSSPGTQLAKMLERLEPVLASEHPDWVIVYGDTTSTLAASLVAARLRLPIAHVEAGCRSADIEMPEEQARIVADHLSRLLLAPSQSAMDNLEREGVGVPDDPRNRRKALVGDVMYDALLQNQKFADEHAERVLQQFALKAREYYLLTLHRAENTDNALRLVAILEAVESLDLPVLFPVHPRTKISLAAAGISVNGKIRQVAPQGYLEMLALEKHANKVLTDSGGVQKEAFYLGVPCITLRDRSEWPETVALGANRIAGTSLETIREAVETDHQSDWMRAAPYGDGRAANKILAELLAGVAQ